MLTFSRISGVVLFGLAACLPGSRTGAFEATDGGSIEKAPLQTFATPRAALQAGLEGFRSGNAAFAFGFRQRRGLPRLEIEQTEVRLGCELAAEQLRRLETLKVVAPTVQPPKDPPTARSRSVSAPARRGVTAGSASCRAPPGGTTASAARCRRSATWMEASTSSDGGRFCTP